MAADRAQAMKTEPVAATAPFTAAIGKQVKRDGDLADVAHEHAIAPVEIARIGLVSLAALNSWLGIWAPWGDRTIIPIVAALIGGYPILREASSALMARRMTMELSMTIAIVAAFVIGESFTGLLIILFVLVAEILEHMTVDRGRRAIGDLLQMLPRQATVLRAGVAHEIPIAELRRGDIVLVRPGARLPVDGKVSSGHSFVDQSAVTGESMPVEKLPGGRIYAGTINQSGSLQVETVEIGRDTAFGKIIEAVEQAEKSRAPIQKTADRLAGYLVYFALAAAAVFGGASAAAVGGPAPRGPADSSLICSLSSGPRRYDSVQRVWNSSGASSCTLLRRKTREPSPERSRSISCRSNA